MRLAQFAKLACSALLCGSSLSGQLQFLDPGSPWSSYPPVVATDTSGNTYVVANMETAATGIIATKFDSTNRVVYSFSFPPVQYVTVLAAVVDSQGSLLIGGSTNSTGFPVWNALLYPRLPTSGFGQRGFVAKLDPSGANLLFSTLVGGDELDWHFASWVTALGVDSADNIYLAGGTSSPTFPVSSNAFQKTGGDQSGSTRSAFLMKISNAGNALQFSTYLGGAKGAN